MFLETRGKQETVIDPGCPDCGYQNLWGPSHCCSYKSCPECGWSEAGEVSELIKEIQHLESIQEKLVTLLERTSLSSFAGPVQFQREAISMLEELTGKTYGPYSVSGT
jgi:hypothetical protein